MGVVCGIPDTNLSMVIFGIVFALLLNWIKSKSTASTDTIISVFSSCCIAIGLAILSRGGNFSKYSSLLVGDILSITKRELVYLLLIFLATIVFWILCYNRLAGYQSAPDACKEQTYPDPVDREPVFCIYCADGYAIY